MEVINERCSEMTKPSLEQIAELLKARYSLTDIQTKDVLELALTLSGQRNKPNDYAIAKALNERASKMFNLVADYANFGGLKNFDENITLINRQYVLVAHELNKIYQRNPELQEAEQSQTPIWRMFDVLEGREYEISKFIYYHENTAGLTHNAQVNKLAIISHNEEPKYNEEQSNLIKETDIAIKAFAKEVDQITNPQDYTDSYSDDISYIPNYQLEYTENGNIIINEVLKLKKTQGGSAMDELLTQAIAHDGKGTFKPDLKTNTRKLSTNVGALLGSNNTLKDLFFPVVSERNGISFRSKVSRATAHKEGIQTSELDTKLKELGAKTAIDDSKIPF